MIPLIMGCASQGGSAPRLRFTARSSSISGTRWGDIAWSPSLSIFCAVGKSSTDDNDARVMTSPDGINWTTRTITSTLDLNCITWNPDRAEFCAGSRTHTAVSSNGIDWTLSTSIPVIGISDIEWSPTFNSYYAVTSNNFISTSADGLNWSGDYKSLLEDPWLSSLAWSPSLGQMVATARSNTGTASSYRSAYTTNGSTWISATIGAFNWSDVCWSPELAKYCAVATTGSSKIVTSSDGINWTTHTGPFGTNELYGVCWGNNSERFVAVGSNNLIMESPNGINWSLVTGISNYAGRAIAYSPSLERFCAVGDGLIGTTEVITGQIS